MDSRDILAALRADGWEQVTRKEATSSSSTLSSPAKFTVPHPRRDLPIGTLKSIEKQARIDLR